MFHFQHSEMNRYKKKKNGYIKWVEVFQMQSNIEYYERYFLTAYTCTFEMRCEKSSQLRNKLKKRCKIKSKPKLYVIKVQKLSVSQKTYAIRISQNGNTQKNFVLRVPILFFSTLYLLALSGFFNLDSISYFWLMSFLCYFHVFFS